MASNYSTIVREKKDKSNVDNEINSKIINMKDIFILVCGVILSRGSFTYYLMPFSYAFFGYIIIYDKKKWWLGVSLLLGIMSTGKYGLLIENIIIYMTMYISYIKLEMYVNRKWKVAILISSNVIIIGLIFNLFGDRYLFDFILVLLQGILSFVLYFIYTTSINLLIDRSRKVYSNQEIISLGIYVSILILGINDLLVYNFSISTILSVFLILLFSFKVGVSISAPLGIILGLIQNLSVNSNPIMIAVYGLCGIVAALFREGGRIFVIIGFVISNAMMAFYINGSTQVFIHVEEILIASSIFLLIPKSVWGKVNFFNYDNINEDYQMFCIERINENIKSKLNQYISLLKEMGTSFSSDQESELMEECYYRSFEKLINNICSKCYLNTRCWKTDINNTYDMLVKTLNILEKNDEDKCYEFKNKCICDQAVLDMLKSEVINIKKERKYYNKIHENNILISEQLKHTGKLLSDLKENLNDGWSIRSEEEKDIIIEMDRNNVNIDKLFVIQEKNGRYKITITISRCYDDNIFNEKVPSILSGVLNSKITLDHKICSYDSKTRNVCKMVYKELSPFKITTGLVRYASKDGEQCGDIFSEKILDNGNRILALCDGMGIGDNALVESNTTINLLEKFMEAEIDKTIMVKTINSILMLRNDKEVFSTLDYVIFDQFTGEAEFNKIGAAITLIIKNNQVKLIRGQSLPVGILNEINIESVSLQLNKGDFIIMMTDGIFECYDNPENVELWIINAINNIRSKNPQKIAKELFEQFLAICENPKDDITILVGKVWKK
ncbi:MAG: stage II sporulation protein E [Eubacteriaceae bacterium]